MQFSAAKAQESPERAGGPGCGAAVGAAVENHGRSGAPGRLQRIFYRRRSRLRCVSKPGVLALYAVAAKEAPGQVTILEIYADRAAYESHITTPHFRKYKEGTLDMVLSLELVDVVPLMPGLELRQTVGTR